MSLVEGSIYYKEGNFWEHNSQLRYMKPFSKLYNQDTSKDREVSSKTMWCLFFLCDPDEDKNKFFRIPENKRKQMLTDTFFPEMEWEGELVEDCALAYELTCLSSIQRSLKQEKDFLAKRAKFIRTTDLTLDSYNEYGKIVKGTAKDLDTMAKNTKAIMDNFKKIEDDFLSEKSRQVLKGGRRETLSEKGLI